MGCRLQTLQNVLEGFARTNIPLILFDGQQLTPFTGYDDIGIYVLIPKLVRFLNISLEQAMNIFFNGIYFSSFVLGILGLLMLYKSNLQRIVSLCALLLLYKFCNAFIIKEVYVAYLTTTLAVLPFFLYFLKNKTDSYLSYFYLFFCGAWIGIFHYVRAFSGLGTLFFILCSISFTKSITIKNKLWLLGFLCLGLSSSIGYFKYVIHTYHTYASQQFPVEAQQLETIHPFWHAVYVGFGFLNFLNKDNIRYDDHFAFDKAWETDPAVPIYTKYYEQIMKNETIKLVKTQSFFVIFSIFAKIGVLLLFLLLFANIGLIASFFFPKEWFIELAFFGSLALNSLFPLMTMPSFDYSLAFIVTTTIYGIVSINKACENFSININFMRFKKATNI